MKSLCMCKSSRIGGAMIALLVTAGITSVATASAPEPQLGLQAQANRALGLSDSTIVTLDLPNEIGRAQLIEIQIKGQGYTLALQPHSVRTNDFVCYEVLPNGTLLKVDPGPSRTFRGTILEDGGSIIAGSLLADGLKAKMLFSNGEQYWIEPLVGRVAGAGFGTHIVYSSQDVLDHGGVCGNPDGPPNFANEAHDDNPLAGTADCITQIACEADFPYFERYGTISTVANQIESVINTMNTQYETEVNITHVISAMVIRTTAAADPYTTTDSFDLVCQLGNYWDTNMGVVVRDTVQLFTGRIINGSTIGRAATFGGICDGTSCGIFPCDGCGSPGEASGHYSFVQSDFNNNFACATDLSAHELGHLWNAQHCSCVGCTMHPNIQCANTFCGPGIAATIIAFRNSVTCLDCTGAASFCGDFNAGNCFTPNASPYCSSSACCDVVCSADPFCCSTRWDQVCANAALVLCGNCGDPDAGNCLDSNGTPGCSDSECCGIICMFDPFCCDNNWDLQCSNEAADFCGAILPDNDLCEDAIAITVPGFAVGFTNDATIDDTFPFCGTSITAPGIWYSVIGTGNTMTATTCSEFTEYDTKISVYCNGCIDPICVGGNDDDCDGFGGLLSTVNWCSEAGTEYLILVHGFSSNTGGFDLSVFDDGVACGNPDGCGAVLVCGDGAGDCCAKGGNGTPGCDDVQCCETVCEFDPFCCDTSWDGSCANEALDLCGICGGACGPDTGDCCVEGGNGTPGCDDIACCETVCAIDPFCCDTSWDSQCAGEALDLCGICGGACGAGTGDCCVASGNGTPGCDDVECCETVCAIDPFCCDTSWDGACANAAADLCAICASSNLIWFNNQGDFEAFVQEQGKVIKGIEDFEESILPFNAVDGFDDPLEFGVPNAPDAFPFPDGMTGLPNLVVQSNALGGAPTVPDPFGTDGLAAGSDGFLGLTSDVVISNLFVNSLDLIFTDEKTAVGFSTVDALGSQIGVEVRVYSSTNVFLGMIVSPANAAGTEFLGVWSPDPIGRVNIFSDGAEGADRIQAWQVDDGIPCPADIDGDGSVGTTDLLILLAAWGTAGPGDIDGDGTVGTADLLILLAAWGPCP